MSAVQIGRYRGGSGTATVTGTGFDEVANVAALATPALTQQLRRVRTNGLTYRTINGGSSWLPISTQVEVVDDTALAALTEMVNGQYVLVTSSNWLWQYTTVNGWVCVDDRTANTVTPIP